jgi:3-isopropylmalate/(R)-2-methylmalate dehydratase small subunit
VEALKIIRSKTVVLPLADMDTDQIIPAKFLTTTTKEGLGKHLFSSWRYNKDGSIVENFIINQINPDEQKILIAGHNFGCGSSREHAPWALLDFGLKAVISTEIADIFFNNALKNGFVPIVVDAKVHNYLVTNPNIEITIDLSSKTLSMSEIGTIDFSIEPFARYCLLNGVDQLGYLLDQMSFINDYESSHGL